MKKLIFKLVTHIQSLIEDIKHQLTLSILKDIIYTIENKFHLDKDVIILDWDNYEELSYNIYIPSNLYNLDEFNEFIWNISIENKNMNLNFGFVEKETNDDTSRPA